MVEIRQKLRMTFCRVQGEADEDEFFNKHGNEMVGEENNLFVLSYDFKIG